MDFSAGAYMSLIHLPLGAFMEMPSLPLTEPVLIIAAVLLLVLILPLLGRAIRTPDIILLILAGMLFGPNGLNLLERGQAIEVWGTVGLLYIMFLAGLEVNVTDFMRNRNRSAILGGLSFVVPQVAGALGAVWLLGFDWTKAILLASMLASFTLLTYPQISRLGLARRESVSVSVGGVLITDTLALLVLAVIVELHGRDYFSWLFILRLAASFSAFLALMVWGVPRIGRWFFSNVARDGGAQFLFVLVVAFMAGALSGLAGVEPIIGAFLAGVTLNRLVPPQSALMNRIEFIGQNLFIPFFLISVGMIVDPRVFIGDTTTWIVGGYMVIAVFGTKFIASKLAQLWLGYTRDEGWVIFGLTVTQAAATLAAVMIGYELGIFDDAVLNGTLMMILATCMASPWITEYFGRRVALSTPATDTRAPESGRILVPVDNPETADRMVELALLLRPAMSDDPLFPLRVVMRGDQDPADITRNEKMMMGVIAQAAAADTPVSPAIRVASGVAEGIQRAATELRISTVLLGTPRNSTLGSLILGGILNDVLQTCRSRVAVCHLAEPPNMLKQILLAVPPNAEREAHFKDTLDLVWRLAHQVGASLTILTPQASQSRLQSIIDSIRPSLTPAWPQVAGWTNACRQLLAPTGSECLRVLITARQGGVSWHPGMDRLPRLLVEAGNSAGTLILYPPLPVAADEPVNVSGTNQPLPELVGVGGACKIPVGTTLETALDIVLAIAIKEPERKECCRLLMQAANEFPITLATDVALIHAHTRAVDTPSIFILTMPQTTQFADVQADVLLVLLGPVGGAPDRHLQILSGLARMMRDPAPLYALRDAPDNATLTRQFAELLSTLGTGRSPQ
jgi:Kef-type K+ transport system membrane component KefB/mannitol/fructose-specific phosphotransferase system IIA component (Ntr-type)/nucleotide-binding universal stress UspA family protein